MKVDTDNAWDPACISTPAYSHWIAGLHSHQRSRHGCSLPGSTELVPIRSPVRPYDLGGQLRPCALDVTLNAVSLERHRRPISDAMAKAVEVEMAATGS